MTPDTILPPDVPEGHGSGHTHARNVLILTGLSGAGKSSILRILEDLGYEVVDNPPLDLFDALTEHSGAKLAIGIDVRSRGFESSRVLEGVARLRARPDCRVQLLYATAEPEVLLRRFTATRRRHPLVAGGSVVAGIEQETRLLAPLRADADLVVDTSDLPLPELRHLINTRFGDGTEGGVSVVLMSFAYPAGLPREADIVLDARFLRNPYYDAELQPLTGLNAEVVEYVMGDPSYGAFYAHIFGLLTLVLPRFVEEGKKYVTIAIGCSGGRHRSVTVVEALARDLSAAAPVGPIMVVHRELSRQGLASWRWAVPPSAA